jgi:clathrin heavy chain
MIKYSAQAWDHPLFKDTISKVSSHEVHFKAIRFYLEEHPLLINDMLSIIIHKLDHIRAVAVIKDANHLPLVKPYLIAVQNENIQAVNEALNQLYIEEEDYQSLKASIENFDKFDNIALSKSLESHTLLDFRRVAAALYRRNQRWRESMELLKKDQVWDEAIQTAAASRSQEISENLLRFFVETENKPNCFASCLYICYDFIRPDVALELAWKHKMMDFAMPYFIQVMRHYFGKVNSISEQAGFGGGNFTVVSGDQTSFQTDGGMPDPSQIFPSVGDGFFPQGNFGQGQGQPGGAFPPFLPPQNNNNPNINTDPSGFQSFGAFY